MNFKVGDLVVRLTSFELETRLSRPGEVWIVKEIVNMPDKIGVAPLDSGYEHTTYPYHDPKDYRKITKIDKALQ